MRVLPPILLIVTLLTGSVHAGEREALEVFEHAVLKEPLGPAGRGRMERAIERLADAGGPVAIRALGRYLHDGFGRERELRKTLFVVKKEGRESFDGMERLVRELKHLRHREQAGATGLGPEIEAREAKLSRSRATFENAKSQTGRLGRVHLAILAQREGCAEACIKILVRIPKEKLSAGFDSLRGTLDVNALAESLLLVRILRQAKRPEASAPLLEIYSHPKSPLQARIEAASAIAALGDVTSIRALVDRLGKDAAFDRKSFLHALSRTAHKKLASLDDAKVWLAGQ